LKIARELHRVHAVTKTEDKVAGEDRLVKVEADVGELKADVKALQARVDDSIVASAREFGSLRALMESGFGLLRSHMEKSLGLLRSDSEKSLGLLRSDMERGFGLLRSDMERGFGLLRAAIESAKLWMLVTGVGSVLLVATFAFLGRILKLV